MANGGFTLAEFNEIPYGEKFTGILWLYEALRRFRFYIVLFGPELIVFGTTFGV